MLVTAEGGNAVRADRGGHPGAGRTAPKRVTSGADPQRIGISENVGNCCGEVLRSDPTPISGAIFHDEGVVSLLTDLLGIREALVDRANIGEPTARRDDREGCTRSSAEEKQAGVLFCRL